MDARPEARFVGAKRLPDGTYAGVLPLMFTYAICLGVTYEASHAKRYCYEDTTTCLHEYGQVASYNDEPQGWVALRLPSGQAAGRPGHG